MRTTMNNLCIKQPDNTTDLEEDGKTPVADVQDWDWEDTYTQGWSPTAQLVGTQDGTVLVPTYSLSTFLGAHLRKVPNITSYHHFTFSRCWYLYNQIREFCCASTEDLVCPRPSDPTKGEADKQTVSPQPPQSLQWVRDFWEAFQPSSSRSLFGPVGSPLILMVQMTVRFIASKMVAWLLQHEKP